MIFKKIFLKIIEIFLKLKQKKDKERKEISTQIKKIINIVYLYPYIPEDPLILANPEFPVFRWRHLVLCYQPHPLDLEQNRTHLCWQWHFKQYSNQLYSICKAACYNQHWFSTISTSCCDVENCPWPLLHLFPINFLCNILNHKNS